LTLIQSLHAHGKQILEQLLTQEADNDPLRVFYLGSEAAFILSSAGLYDISDKYMSPKWIKWTSTRCAVVDAATMLSTEIVPPFSHDNLTLPSEQTIIISKLNVDCIAQYLKFIIYIEPVSVCFQRFTVITDLIHKLSIISEISTELEHHSLA
jgi:hypothetical protein